MTGKTYQIWLILEETDDDSPQSQLETYQLAATRNLEQAESLFEQVQELLESVKNLIPDNLAH